MSGVPDGYEKLSRDIPLDHEVMAAPPAATPVAQAPARPTGMHVSNDEYQQVIGDLTNQYQRGTLPVNDYMAKVNAYAISVGHETPYEPSLGASTPEQVATYNAHPAAAAPAPHPAMALAVPSQEVPSDLPAPDANATPVPSDLQPQEPIPDDYMKVPQGTPLDAPPMSGMTQAQLHAKFDQMPAGLQPGLTDLAEHGLSGGLGNEVYPLAKAAYTAIAHPIDTYNTGGGNVSDAYHQARTNALAQDDYARMQTGGMGTAAEVAGAAMNPVFRLASGVGGAMAANALYSGVNGFESSNGTPQERALAAGHDAGIGGGFAGVLGGAMRLPGAISRATAPFIGNATAMAGRAISQALEADRTAPQQAAQQIIAGQAHGVPTMLADTGDNARGLLAGATMTPGPSRAIAREALVNRQLGLRDRITGAITRNLGPVANPHEVAEQLMKQARNASRPFYSRAYKQPGAGTFVTRMSKLMQRPSIQAALKNAVELAKEEGRDPSTLGFDVNSSGEVTTGKVPSWETLDFVKRGLDDVLEKYRDKTSGKLVLDDHGTKVLNTLNSFKKAIDIANPDYAKARALYSGPVKGLEYMERGRRALRLNADDLEHDMRGLTSYQKDMYALGIRRAMTEAVEDTGDATDIVHKLAGTGKKRAMLARLFGDRKGFQSFVDTLDHEKQAFATFKAANLGSPTAEKLGNMKSVDVAALATETALKGIPWMTALRMAVNHGAGKIGVEARQQIAELLSNTDPARFKELLVSLRGEMARRGMITKHVGVGAGVGGRALATAVAINPAQNGPQ